MANRTREAVPTARRGTLGLHRHRYQPPMDWLSACATVPTTSAQYPQPAQARRIDTATERARATTSLPEVMEKRIARLRSARCKTEVLLIKIVKETPRAMSDTAGLR